MIFSLKYVVIFILVKDVNVIAVNGVDVFLVLDDFLQHTIFITMDINPCLYAIINYVRWIFVNISIIKMYLVLTCVEDWSGIGNPYWVTTIIAFDLLSINNKIRLPTWKKYPCYKILAQGFLFTDIYLWHCIIQTIYQIWIVKVIGTINVWSLWRILIIVKNIVLCYLCKNLIIRCLEPFIDTWVYHVLIRYILNLGLAHLQPAIYQYVVENCLS